MLMAAEAVIWAAVVTWVAAMLVVPVVLEVVAMHEQLAQADHTPVHHMQELIRRVVLTEHMVHMQDMEAMVVMVVMAAIINIIKIGIMDVVMDGAGELAVGVEDGDGAFGAGRSGGDYGIHGRSYMSEA
jgi:hypothetical protein